MFPLLTETFNKNMKVEKFTNMLGIAVRLIVIDPSPYGKLVEYGIKLLLRFIREVNSRRSI